MCIRDRFTDLVLGWLYSTGGPAGGLLVIAFFGLVTAAAWLVAAGIGPAIWPVRLFACTCLLYTSDAADERSSVDLGGRRIITKKKQKKREKKEMKQEKKR